CASGSCAPSHMPDGTVCHWMNDPAHRLCSAGHCLNGVCRNVTAPVDSPVPQACGGHNGECQPDTGLCVYPDHAPWPSYGQIYCGNIFTGPDLRKCCPGQVCICAPTPSGVPRFCLESYCWNPEDVPSPTLSEPE